jgi:PqqD family protein of HPr-rel-A system
VPLHLSASVPTFWRLEEPSHLVEREWDGEVIVLNTQTGSTHLLEPAAALIYRLLQLHPQSDVELIEQLTAELDTGDPDDARTMVEATLLEFLRLGLIECAPVENR